MTAYNEIYKMRRFQRTIIVVLTQDLRSQFKTIYIYILAQIQFSRPDVNDWTGMCEMVQLAGCTRYMRSHQPSLFKSPPCYFRF